MNMFSRLRSSTTPCNTSVHRLFFRSTPAAEESVNRRDLSHYQELNFSLQEKPLSMYLTIVDLYDEYFCMNKIQMEKVQVYIFNKSFFYL